MPTKNGMLIIHVSVRNNVTHLKVSDLLRTLTSSFIALVLLVKSMSFLTGNMLYTDFEHFSVLTSLFIPSLHLLNLKTNTIFIIWIYICILKISTNVPQTLVSTVRRAAIFRTSIRASVHRAEMEKTVIRVGVITHTNTHTIYIYIYCKDTIIITPKWFCVCVNTACSELII